LLARWGRAGAGRSIDLRARVVAAIDAGQTLEQAAIRFGVSVHSVGRYAARRPPTGSVAPMHAWLPASLAADVTVAAHAAAFAAETGDSCRWRSPAGRSR